MKFRTNYVSNSSSSSYIVEFKNIEQIIRIAGEEISVQTFFDAIRSHTSFASETEMHEITFDNEDKNNMIKVIDYTLQYVDNQNEIFNLNQLKNDIANSKDTMFARFDISYHNKALRFLFKLLCKYGLFEIRWKADE